jgi:hypothetical protein
VLATDARTKVVAVWLVARAPPPFLKGGGLQPTGRQASPPPKGRPGQHPTSTEAIGAANVINLKVRINNLCFLLPLCFLLSKQRQKATQRQKMQKSKKKTKKKMQKNKIK